MANKALKKVLVFTGLSCVSLFTVSGCSSSKDTITLRILNMEDYIYVYSPKDQCYEPTIYEEPFQDYLKKNYPEFNDKHIEVIYDTTDTCETLYSKLQTGKAAYDLICVSDYMIQKMLSQQMILPINHSLVPNYYGTAEKNGYASKYLFNYLKSITSEVYKTKEVFSISDYCVGYFWGTLGVTFNPTYQTFKERGLNPVDDFADWKSFWNKDYQKTFTIKNSMRDTYFLGALEKNRDELIRALEQYRKGEISEKEYNQIISNAANQSDEENIKKVFDKLYPLKDNAFGFEVESGKEDIVTKKIGAQFAFSGDAGYSMSQAANRFQVTEPFDLYYSVPFTGSNLWFDTFAIPNTERTENQNKLAHAFLNFIADPFYAQKNMYYTGYTPFYGGVEIRDYVLDSYDARTDEIYVLDEQKDKDVYYSIFYQYPDAGKELTEAYYNDCLKKEDQDPAFDNVELRYYKGEFEINEEGVYIDSSTKEEITFNSSKMIPLEEKYNERFEIKSDWDVVDLSYIFEGTIDEATPEDFIFYCDGYYVEEGNNCVGGQFYAQYPDKETIIRSAVAKDFRENNSTLMKYWEEFKSNSLPTWAIVVFAVEGAAALIIISLLVSKKIIKNNMKKNRRKQQMSK